LTAVDIGIGADIEAIQESHQERYWHSAEPEQPCQLPGSPLFSELCRKTSSRLVEAARSWRADIIIYGPEAPAALAVASLLGIPAVFVSIGLAHTPELMASRYPITDLALDAYGLQVLPNPAAWIDMTPPSLRSSRTAGWAMRHITYGGGETLASEDAPSARPLVAVTLGTVIPFVFGLKPLRAVMHAARSVDANFVVVHGTTHTRDLGTLPSNVETVSWIPIDRLLSGCCATVHHGGFGTTMASLSHGVPQMMLPLGADHFCNAELVTRQGAGVRATPESLDADALRHLLNDQTLRQSAFSLQREIAHMPPPSDVVSRLVDLAG